MEIKFNEPAVSAFPDLPPTGDALVTPPSTSMAPKPDRLLEKPSTTKPDPTLPKYLQIKLTPKAIATLPINQQAIARHVMVLQKNPNNRQSRSFLRQWVKRVKTNSERNALTKLIND